MDNKKDDSYYAKKALDTYLQSKNTLVINPIPISFLTMNWWMLLCSDLSN